MFIVLPQHIACLTEESTQWLYLLGEKARILGIASCTLRPCRAQEEKSKLSVFVSAKIVKILALQHNENEVFGLFDVSADSVDIPQGESRNIVDAPSLIKCWDEILQPLSYREAQCA
jgi:hypothetical protein